MSLWDRFKSKKMIAIAYRKEDLEELLQMELTEYDFIQVRTAWNEMVDKMDLNEVDAIVQTWFADTFSFKLERKKK